MATRVSSPPPLRVPQNTPSSSRPATSAGTPASLTSSSPFQTPYTLASLVNTLLPTTHLLHTPTHTRNTLLTPQISALELHPTLEAALHILNADLPSAHFLLRHLRAPPAVEGMLLYAVLLRIEGDVGNARSWVRDVRNATKQGLLEFVYYEEEDGEGVPERLINDVVRFRNKKNGSGRNEDEDEEADIEDRIRTELERIIEWCKRKFGGGK